MPHGRVGLVDVLAAGARRAVGVDAQVLLVDLDLVGEVLQEGDHVERGEAGLAPVLGVERRDPDQAVHAALGREQAVGEAAPDDEGGREQARLLALGRLVDLDAEAAPLGPARVHAQQHLGPVLGVGAPGARVDLGDRVALVVLAREERLQLEPAEAGSESSSVSSSSLVSESSGAPSASASSTSSSSTRASSRLRSSCSSSLEVVAHPPELGGHLAGVVRDRPTGGLGGLLLELGPAGPQGSRCRGSPRPPSAGCRAPRARRRGRDDPLPARLRRRHGRA